MTLTIIKEVSVPKARHENKAASVTASLTSTLACTNNVGLFSASIDELVDFRGLGKIERTFVPLLEEVCSRHPSLIECQKKRSRMFTEWALTALGRVLYFLKTRKVKDMDEQACKDLQLLWEELETFKFDLSWLKPYVQFALRMENYVEEIVAAEKLKENVAALELEMKRLNLKLVVAKANLDKVSNFLKEEGFHEIDWEVELGYGRL